MEYLCYVQYIKCQQIITLKYHWKIVGKYLATYLTLTFCHPPMNALNKGVVVHSMKQPHSVSSRICTHKRVCVSKWMCVTILPRTRNGHRLAKAHANTHTNMSVYTHKHTRVRSCTPTYLYMHTRTHNRPHAKSANAHTLHTSTRMCTQMCIILEILLPLDTLSMENLQRIIFAELLYYI